MAKKNKKKRLLDGTDIALAILAALGGSVLFMTAVLVAGSIMFPDSGKRVTAEAPSAQPSYRGTLPSRAPTQAPTPEAVESIVPDVTDAPESAQTPSEAVHDAPEPANSQASAQNNTPSPAASKAPAPTTTRAPTPARAPAAQNPGPVVSINPTAPPTRQTQAPAQSGNAGTIRNNDGTYTHDFSGGKMLGTINSDKYHYYDCRAAKTIPPENCVWYNSEEEAKADDRSRCGICWR